MSSLIVASFFGILTTLLLVYGLNSLVMVWLFIRRYERRHREQLSFIKDYKVTSWPKVTTQIPVYNEANVVERVIDAVCAMEYPSGDHAVQILDDSTDGTSRLIDERVEQHRQSGVNIRVIRRSNRQGYKAGALHEAHEEIEGELLAIFDADFVPPKDFLLKSVPFMVDGADLGFIQARWEHLNRNQSWLTKAQALGIDGHFMVEQAGRCWNDLYLNFNGTAGLWRKKAIEDGGGWSWDTLTEDMDLSYRVQLAGWEAEYLPWLSVPAELPEDINAFKSQQFRWAKGSIQTALKILPKLWKKEGLNFRFVQASLHMTHYLIHPLMVAMAISSYFLLNTWSHIPVWLTTTFLVGILISMVSTNTLYWVSQWKLGTSRRQTFKTMPGLMLLGVGIAINNSRAVLQALRRKESEFVRTPKRGDQILTSYKVSIPFVVALEILLGMTCLWGIWDHQMEGSWFHPFLLLYALGFSLVGWTTLLHANRNRQGPLGVT